VRGPWLAIEGALGTFSAAVDVEGAPTTIDVPGKDALERGLTAVAEVLRRAGVATAALSGIAAGTGPGSFTGLRIALSYAKGLAFALRLPLIGVSSYDVLEYPAADAPSLAVVHGRSGVACARLRTDAGSWVRCGPYDAVAEMVMEHVAPRLLPVHGGVEGVAARLAERGFTVRAFPKPDSPALVVAQLAVRRAADGASRSLHEVRPDYGELPAVTPPREGR
jgi:tRNA threonylcarbamoyl adenosine modification protein YeaZ